MPNGTYGGVRGGLNFTYSIFLLDFLLKLVIIGKSGGLDGS